MPVAASATAMLASAALAAPSYFTGDPVSQRAAFQAAAGALQVESFEGPDRPSSSEIDFPTSGPTAFTLTSSHNMSISTFARATSHGTQSLFTGNESGALVFSFAQPITAFGVDVNDLNFANLSYSDDQGHQLLQALLGDDCGPDGGPDCQNLQFLGVVSSVPFQEVRLQLSAPSGLGNLYVDRVEYQVVPEPSSALLVAAGLGGLAARRRSGRPGGRRRIR